MIPKPPQPNLPHGIKTTSHFNSSLSHTLLNSLSYSYSHTHTHSHPHPVPHSIKGTTPSSSILTANHAKNATDLSSWLKKLIPYFHLFINILLPLLDTYDYVQGWILGSLWGPRFTPVREWSGTDAVILSGASTGIGYDTAITLANRGIVVFAGIRSQMDMDRLLSLNLSNLIPIHLDITSTPSIQAAKSIVLGTLAQRSNDHGNGNQSIQLVGIINNAGISTMGTMETCTHQDLNTILNVNVFGALDFTQAFLPLMRLHGRGGRILLIGSVVGKASMAYNGVYTASKRAVEAMFEVMQQELAPEGIHVSIIRPGAISTSLWDKIQLPPQIESNITDLFHLTSRYLSISPSHVTRSIVHALSASQPLNNYVVGLDARIIFAVQNFLPDRLYNKLIKLLLHM